MLERKLRKSDRNKNGRGEIIATRIATVTMSRASITTVNRKPTITSSALKTGGVELEYVIELSEDKHELIKMAAAAGIGDWVYRIVAKGKPLEPRKGHWITRPHIYGVDFCSECGFELKINNTNYCPNCGADMREVEE